MSSRSCPSHTSHHCPIKASDVVDSVRVDLKEVSAFRCLCVCSVSILEVEMHRVALNEGETRDQSSSRGVLSLSWVVSKVNPHEYNFLHTHTSDTPSLIPTLVLPEIAKITGITVFTALIYYRLKPLNNSECTHRRTHTQPWAPVCGLSGAADGWLIDWGGPLMISVANDLLNNSPSLCWGADGRPNTYTDMLTGTLMHLFVLSYAYIQIFIHTHFLPAHTGSLQLSCLPLSLPCCSHLGCFTSPLPSFPDTTIQSCTIKTKVSRHLCLKS